MRGLVTQTMQVIIPAVAAAIACPLRAVGDLFVRYASAVWPWRQSS